MTIALAPDLTTTDTEDGMVLLNERTGRYWMLNTTGASTLRLALAGRSAEEVAAELTAGSPQDASRALDDVRTLMGSLVRARLVVAS
ncbi:lasso peptide biosynthesis PqqD family chaperone [Micromonospora sp. NBC_01796]|uniref:lasso peptide biosynthesis PqqD family chaperone n=1 Tax=Micromonospora sp. NBC_01796 TaxID=2975987 RepID=UPI002DD83465|nr:lasso peptide biosynthesis PqqD family chaperone [Micromonospora sp. NBC_01796]WSA83847.1 lasso peptide biosynthesis PqqD family chaperone [Micromonospora sp. NBC_01796]